MTVAYLIRRRAELAGLLLRTLGRTTKLAPAGSVLLAGCARGPSIPVLGAYFPDWLFCIVGGVVATIMLRALLQRLDRDDWLKPPAVVYPALFLLFALGGWLLVFPH